MPDAGGNPSVEDLAKHAGVNVARSVLMAARGVSVLCWTCGVPNERMSVLIEERAKAIREVGSADIVTSEKAVLILEVYARFLHGAAQELRVQLQREKEGAQG